MADAWDQFKDAGPSAATADPWAQFSDVPQQGNGFLRGVGIGTRDLIQAAGNVALLPADLGVGARNVLGNLFNKATGRPATADYTLPSEMLSQSLDQVGMPTAQTSTEKLLSAGTRAAGNAATTYLTGGLAGGTPWADVARNVLTASPEMQLPSAVSGGMSAEVARQNGASPTMQTVAGIAGGFAPSAIRYGVTEGTKAAFRGGGADARQNVADNINTFNAVGTSPSVGQASETRLARGAESLLSRTPGGAGVMAGSAKNQAQEIGAGLDARAASLSPAEASAQQTGEAITKGITGEGGFLENFKKTQEKLYDKLDLHLLPGQPVKVENTRAALESLNANIPEAEALSKWFKNARIQGIEAALTKDRTIPAVPDTQVEQFNPLGSVTGQPTRTMVTVPGTPESVRDWMPYESIKKLRTLVGSEMADSSPWSDVPRSKWKALYGALSQDLGEVAAQSGPEAKQAWSRANNYTRSGMRRIEVLDGVLSKNGGPEAVYKSTMSGTADGATRLRAVLQSIPKDAQETLTATIVRRMGRATAGIQNDTGDMFSTQTFLTNWNKLSPEAKATLFDRHDPEFRANMDQVAKVASNLRDGSAVFRNPSGTAQAIGQTAAVGSFFGFLASGQYLAAAGVASGVGLANLDARVMTNPEFVRWLAKTTKAPISAGPVLINQLARSRDPDLQKIAADLQEQGASNQRQ